MTKFVLGFLCGQLAMILFDELLAWRRRRFLRWQQEQWRKEDE